MQDQESGIDQGLDRLAHILARWFAIAFFPAVALVLECLRYNLADGPMGRLSGDCSPSTPMPAMRRCKVIAFSASSARSCALVLGDGGPPEPLPSSTCRTTMDLRGSVSCSGWKLIPSILNRPLAGSPSGPYPDASSDFRPSGPLRWTRPDSHAARTHRASPPLGVIAAVVRAAPPPGHLGRRCTLAIIPAMAELLFFLPSRRWTPTACRSR